MLRNTVLARGKTSSDNAIAKDGHTVIDTHSGQDACFSANRTSGITICPTNRMVSQGAPSSDRRCPYASPQSAQWSTGFKYDANNFPWPQLGHRPDSPRPITTPSPSRTSDPVSFIKADAFPEWRKNLWRARQPSSSHRYYSHSYNNLNTGANCHTHPKPILHYGDWL